MPGDQKIFCWYRRYLRVEPDLFYQLPVYRVFAERALAFKILRHLPANDLQSLSFASNDFLEMIRTYLKKRFISFLRDFNIPSSFIDIMRINKVVISGSAVFKFIRPELVDLWEEKKVPIADLDFFVRHGTAKAIFDYLDNIPGVACEVLESDMDVSPTSFLVEKIFHEAPPLYWFPGVASVTELILRAQTSPHEVHRVHIIEASAPSPLYPIVQLNFTHLQNVLSPDGLVMFNPKHTFSFRSIINPTILVGYNRGTIPEDYREDYIKNLRRGFSIYLHAMDVPYESSHSCGKSFSCPQTLRNTEDGGTFFLPFSATAFRERAQAKRAYCPTVMWRVGGDSCDAYKNPSGKASCAFMAPALNQEFDVDPLGCL
ncbi:hypothetical protein SCHPADRAFT_935734 [Schizopora paradoxa]|uniref:Uncharacterized protein n=1 Tax=Schizopora paradoxa TaxID=27342 RepID=A0A0H2SAX6_9AGAM|nr:hypothetical protein SCHPADRAFT_935734 [Schizopora paradoxa]